MIYLKFLKSLLFHKWFVFLAGLKIGVSPWKLIIHDWHKFHPLEFPKYAKNFYGDYTSSPNDREQVSLEYAYAWLHHENLAPHHWGHWIPRTGKFAGKPFEMPEKYVREMVADWMGASKTYTGSWDMYEYLESSLPTFRLHSGTRLKLALILNDCGYDEDLVYDWLYRK